MSIGLEQWPSFSSSWCMPSVTRLMQVDSTPMRCPESSRRRTVLLSASYKLVSPCSSTFQESVPLSSRPRIRTLESLLVRRRFVYLFHSLLVFSFSSFPDFTSDRPMRISLDQMMRLSQTIGSSQRKHCHWSTLSFRGSGTCPHFSSTS